MTDLRPYAKALILSALISLFATQAQAQAKAEISADLSTYDFGSIPETKEGATHIFSIKNTGATPLVIASVSTSCGCARPEWNKAPIPPGASSELKINYLTKGRPGPFYKSITIHSNASSPRLTLYIKGTVTSQPSAPVPPPIVYPYTLGSLKLETKTVICNKAFPGDTISSTIHIKNESSTQLKLHADKIPSFLSVDFAPATLNPEETGEITIALRTTGIKQMGRIATSFSLIAEDHAGHKESPVVIKANIIDNFSRLSPEKKAQAPVAEYSVTHIDFGHLPEKATGILPFISTGKETAILKITNTGKSPLIIYSISSDNPIIDIAGSKKEIKPGASADYKISIRIKDIKTKLEDDIYVVGNDPVTPVKLIKVTAER
jgi:hypothetical protein